MDDVPADPPKRLCNEYASTACKRYFMQLQNVRYCWGIAGLGIMDAYLVK
jgi:hypothetical protein